jgi:hypothetical protein
MSYAPLPTPTRSPRHLLDRTHRRADSRMDALARTHTRIRIDMWPYGYIRPFFWEFYIIINFCCHQYHFDCDCGHTAILVCYAASVQTRHRSPAPVLQLSCRPPLHSPCSHTTPKHLINIAIPTPLPTLAAPLILLSVYPPLVAST